MEFNNQLNQTITDFAEVAGYLWQKGWAERNGGNISINITDEVDDKIRAIKPISGKIAIGMELPCIKNMYFLCKGTNRRMRDLARWPMENATIIRICEDGLNYEVIINKEVKPTSELPAHLAIHNLMVKKNNGYKAVIHTHPIDLVAMSHNPKFLEKDVLSKLLWSMIPETRAFCPKGLGISRYELPGSTKLANSTIEQLDEYDVVLWEKHGVCAVGHNVMEAFDFIDVLSKSAQIYLTSKSMGFVPEGMSDAQMDEMKVAFNL